MNTTVEVEKRNTESFVERMRAYASGVKAIEKDREESNDGKEEEA